MINAVVVVALVISYYWRGEKRSQKSKFRAGANPRSKKVRVRPETSAHIQADRDASMDRTEERVVGEAIMFDYKGVQLEAYSVLGLTAGASFSDVQTAHIDLSEKRSEEREVFDLALKAISSS